MKGVDLQLPGEEAMRLLAAMITALLTASLAPSAQALAENPATVVGDDQRPDAQTVEFTVHSPSLDGLFQWKKVRLLVPKDWSKDATRTWPTLWLLHGASGDHQSWTGGSHIKQLVADRGVIVVMPETNACSSYSDWWNYGNGGAPAFETYLVDQLRPLLEQKYHASTDRAAVAGLSMGGLGAMKLAANHPGMFKSAASYSGAVSPLFQATDGTLNGPDAVKASGLVCLGTDWKKIWGEPGYPFDTTNPQDVRQRAIWQRASPVVQAEGLRGIPLYVSFGDGTSGDAGWQYPEPPNPARCTNPSNNPKGEAVEHLVYGMGHQLVDKLDSAHIPVTVCAHAGTHAWLYWDRELNASFPMLMSSIGA
ncbi:hypothetical protein D5S17_21230 [Pseudonocardiaceae bacterium YIM PH 21723]|nr:hypothetical protein D5S17_21230 [Pseudonocardiaceae bacterium YIM PH 21723]